MQRCWNLSKLVTDTFVNFGNSFNSIILYPFVLRKKISSKNAVREEWAIPIHLEDNDKNLGERFALGAWLKMNRFNFLTHKCICSNLGTLKLLCDQGGLYRFRKKFKKNSGEINSLGVHGKWGDWFCNSGSDTSAHWYSQIPIFLGSSSWTVFEVEENFMQSLSAFYYFFRDKNSF